MKTKLNLAAALSMLVFHLSAQNRLVLIEQFSNSSCGPCAAASPTIYNYANNNQQKAVVIAYHTSFPYYNDSMYFDNVTENDARVNYYSVAGVPNSIIDGNVYNGSTASLNPNLNTSITNRGLVSPRFNITESNLKLVNGQLTGDISFTSIDSANANQNLVAYIVVIEKKVLKSTFAASPGNNSETEYGYVMRKMYPNALGTVLSNTILGASEIVNLNWSISRIKNINEIRVVAFVQNISTKEVYQTQLFTPTISVGINEVETFDNLKFRLDRLNKDLFIDFDSSTEIRSIGIINSLGQSVYNENINGIISNHHINTNFEGGVYFLVVRTSQRNYMKKVLLN